MNRIVSCAVSIICLCIIGCTDQKKQATSIPDPALPVNNTINTMNSYISIFEIPAVDMNRAVSFYETILNLDIETMKMHGMHMGIMPFEEQMVTGLIIKGEGYIPSTTGVTIYLNGGDNLQLILDKVATAGGEVLVPKTPHADDSGYFALFMDTEGNRLGLNSPN